MYEEIDFSNRMYDKSIKFIKAQPDSEIKVWKEVFAESNEKILLDTLISIRERGESPRFVKVLPLAFIIAMGGE